VHDGSCIVVGYAHITVSSDKNCTDRAAILSFFEGANETCLALAFSTIESLEGRHVHQGYEPVGPNS
jgi:hypothetical protein